MKKELTAEKLDSYLVTNGSYYHRFINKFNEKGSFNSFNLFALLLAPAWTAYRKVWFVYGALLMFQVLMAIFFYMTEQPNTTKFFDIALKITIIIFAIGSIRIIFFSNSILLRKANDARENETGKSSWFVVLLASIVFFLPASALIYKLYYPKYISYKNSISYQKTINKKEVGFRVGNIKLQEGMLSGVLQQSGETIYYQPQPFLTNDHLEDSFVRYDMGRPSLVIKLTEEGVILFQINSKKYSDQYIVILLESKPLLIFKTMGEELSSRYISIPVEGASDYSDLLTYLHGQSMIKNEHENFFKWLYCNF